MQAARSSPGSQQPTRCGAPPHLYHAQQRRPVERQRLRRGPAVHSAEPDPEQALPGHHGLVHRTPPAERRSRRARRRPHRRAQRRCAGDVVRRRPGACVGLGEQPHAPAHDDQVRRPVAVVPGVCHRREAGAADLDQSLLSGRGPGRLPLGMVGEGSVADAGRRSRACAQDPAQPRRRHVVCSERVRRGSADRYRLLQAGPALQRAHCRRAVAQRDPGRRGRSAQARASGRLGRHRRVSREHRRHRRRRVRRGAHELPADADPAGRGVRAQALLRRGGSARERRQDAAQVPVARAPVGGLRRRRQVPALA